MDIKYDSQKKIFTHTSYKTVSLTRSCITLCSFYVIFLLYYFRFLLLIMIVFVFTSSLVFHYYTQITYQKICHMIMVKNNIISVPYHDKTD